MGPAYLSSRFHARRRCLTTHFTDSFAFCAEILEGKSHVVISILENFNMHLLKKKKKGHLKKIITVTVTFNTSNRSPSHPVPTLPLHGQVGLAEPGFKPCAWRSQFGSEPLAHVVPTRETPPQGDPTRERPTASELSVGPVCCLQHVLVS